MDRATINIAGESIQIRWHTGGALRHLLELKKAECERCDGTPR